MVHRQECRIVAIRAAFSGMFGVTPHVAVILRRPRCMAGRALRVHVDRARGPGGRRLSAMAADIRTGAVRTVGGCAAFRVIHRSERQEDRCPAIGVVGRARAAAVVAGGALAGHVRQGIVLGVAAGAVRRCGAVRRAAVAGRAVPGREGRPGSMAGGAGASRAAAQRRSVAERAGNRHVAGGLMAGRVSIFPRYRMGSAHRVTG